MWPDGRRYIGQFVDGLFDGFGVYTQQKNEVGVEVSEGLWKAGQLHGLAITRLSYFCLFI